MRIKDISGYDKTLVKKINDTFINRLGSMTYDEIKEEFISCLDSGDVSIAEETKNKYKIELKKKKNLLSLQEWIYNISLKGSGLGTI